MNSHKARLAAGRDLEKYALQLTSSSSVPNLHFIGHSHGGNVALYALRNSIVRGGTKTTSFLGTPFIQLKQRKFDNRILFFSQVAAWVSCLMLLSIALFIGIGWKLGGEGFNFFIMFFVFLPAMILHLFFGRPRVRDGLCRFLTAKLSLAQQEALDWLWQPVPTQPVYIATVPADEARLWLKLIDAISSFPWAVWEWIYRSMLGVVIGFVIYYVYLDAKAELAGENPDAYLDGMGTMFSFILVLLVGGIVTPISGLLISSLFRGNPFAFGWEGIWSHALVGLTPSERPNWGLPLGSRVSILKAKPYSFGRHSAFYQDSQIIADLTSWFCIGRDVDSEVRFEAPTRRLRNRVKPWSIYALAGLATIVTCELLFERYMVGLDSIHTLSLGSVDGLDQRFRRKLLAVSDLYIGAKDENKWTIKQVVKPRSRNRSHPRSVAALL